jgi:hypothetical protein
MQLEACSEKEGSLYFDGDGMDEVRMRGPNGKIYAFVLY